MYKVFSSTQKAYFAGFLDGDGSIYVRAKPNKTYKYGFQIAPYIVLFQSSKDKSGFEKLTSLLREVGYVRERSDGILEYIIGKTDNIETFLNLVEPYVLLKKPQVVLMKKILAKKKDIKGKKDFLVLMKLVDSFRDINYSKRRKIRVLTP